MSYHILEAGLTLMALKTEPSELDWLQVYDMTHRQKIVLRTGASLLLILICKIKSEEDCWFVIDGSL